MTTKNSDSWIQDTLRQGFEHLQAGRLDAAGNCCHRVLEAQRDLPEGHFLVGLIALELDQRRTAIEAFGSVTKLRPDHGAAWAHLARLFMQVGQPARADQSLEKAVEHEDGNPVVHDLIGLVHTQLGDDEEAYAWHKRAAAAQPENVAIRVNHANSQMFVGRLEDAEASIRAALRLQPGNPNAHWILSGLKKASDRQHVNEIEKLIATGVYPPKALTFLQYARGKELEDLEEWDAAFAAFDAGAQAKRQTLGYDEAKEEALYASLESLMTEEWLASEPRQGCDNDSPIFIVGQPRTGTTLVERIVTAHSEVHSAGELKQFGNALRRLTGYSGPARFSAELVTEAAALDCRKVGEMYIETTRKMAGSTPRFVDKLPSNFLYLPLILKALPNAKIVHLQRDPMDACFSSYKQLFADAYPHSYQLNEMARHHVRYFKLMELWRQRFGDRYFEIGYEDVATNLEANARALIDFLDLDWEDSCLQFHQQKSAVTTASAVQVRQPVHTKSIGRWRRYEQQLAPVRKILMAAGVPEVRAASSQAR
jgi:tetratricopeptide (TPR) repeat protein